MLALGTSLVVHRAISRPVSTMPLVPVRVGSLAVTVDATGEIAPPAPVDLTFPVPGVITALRVSPGQAVHAGEVLARLDATSLRAQVDQARANLEEAKAKYLAVLHPFSPAQLAVDRAQVRNAAEALASAQRLLKDQEAIYRDTLPQQGQVLTARNQLSQAEAEIAADEAALRAAEAKLAQTRYPTPPAVLAADETQVQNARRLVADAEQLLKDQEALAQDTLSAQSQVLAAKQQLNNALSQVTQDQAAVSKAQAALQLAEEGPTPVDLQAAQTQLQDAQSTLSLLQSELQAAEQAATTDSQEVATDQQLAASAEDTLSVAQAAYQQGKATLPQLQAAETAALNAQSQLQQAIAQDNQAQTQLTNLQISINQAQSAVAQDQKALSDLQAQPDTNQVAQAQDALTQAEDAYQAAETAYALAERQLQNAEAQAQSHAQATLAVDQARASLVQAENTYRQALAALKEDTAPAPSPEVAQARDAVLQAAASLAGAKRAYRDMQAQLAYAEQLARDRTQARLAVDQAKATVRQDEDNLRLSRLQLAADLAPPTPATVAQARAEVAVARAQLEAAEASYRETVLRAPESGQVLTVNVVLGQAVTAQTVVAELNPSPGTEEVDALLSAADIASVHPAEPARITSSAYPGKVFPGRVLSVTPAAETVSGVSLYPVTLSVDPSGSPHRHAGRHRHRRVRTASSAIRLLPGLPVDVTIVSQSLRHVMLLPITAVRESPSGAADVLLPTPHGLVRRRVVVGASNGILIQVVSGLRPGEKVALYAQPKALLAGIQAAQGTAPGRPGPLGGFRLPARGGRIP